MRAAREACDEFDACEAATDEELESMMHQAALVVRAATAFLRKLSSELSASGRTTTARVVLESAELCERTVAAH